MMDLSDREELIGLLEQNVEDNYQRLHARMVAAAMEAYAEKFEPENNDLWYATGLLHDIDYDKWPENHPDDELIRDLTSNSFPEEFYLAIQGHALYRNIPRKTKMAQTLLAVDELSGLFYAIAKMRPDGFDMKVKSVKKKFKDKSFAAKIDRNDIKLGIEELGIDLNEHLEFLIPVFKKFSDKL